MQVLAEPEREGERALAVVLGRGRRGVRDGEPRRLDRLLRRRRGQDGQREPDRERLARGAADGVRRRAVERGRKRDEDVLVGRGGRDRDPPAPGVAGDDALHARERAAGDPKGLGRYGAAERSKVALHTTIKKTEAQVRMTDPDLRLHAFVLSVTAPDEIGDEPHTVSEWQDRGVYFLARPDWAQRLIGCMLD